MQNFNGFSSPTHTQTPQEFFEIVASKGVTIAEVKILAFMIRETFGWQKGGHSLHMTFKSIMKATNLGKEAVNNGLHKCLDKGYIERAEMLGEMYYRIKLADEDPAQGVWEVAIDWENNHRTKVVKAEPIKIEGKLARKQVRKSNHDSGSEIEPTAVRKSNRQRFGNRTDSGSEIEPTNIGQTQAIQGFEASRKKGLNKDLNISLNINNNKEDSIQNLEEVTTEVQKDVVVDFLSKHGLTANKTILKKWRGLALNDEIIIDAIKRTVIKDEIENVIGYVTRMLEAGYTPTVKKMVSKESDIPKYVVERNNSEQKQQTNQIDIDQQKEVLDLLFQLGEINQEDYDLRLKQLIEQ